MWIKIFKGYLSRRIDATNKVLGLSNAAIKQNATTLTCTFTRDNTNGFNSYYNLFPGNNFYFIAAYGNMVQSMVYSLYLIEIYSFIFKYFFTDTEEINVHLSRFISPIEVFSDASATTPAPITASTAASTATAVTNPQTTNSNLKVIQKGAYKLEWTEGYDYIDFVFTTTGQIPFDGYTAFAFSLDDSQMVCFNK